MLLRFGGLIRALVAASRAFGASAWPPLFTPRAALSLRPGARQAAQWFLAFGPGTWSGTLTSAIGAAIETHLLYLYSDFADSQATS